MHEREKKKKDYESVIYEEEQLKKKGREDENKEKKEEGEKYRAGKESWEIDTDIHSKGKETKMLFYFHTTNFIRILIIQGNLYRNWRNSQRLLVYQFIEYFRVSNISNCTAFSVRTLFIERNWKLIYKN